MRFQRSAILFESMMENIPILYILLILLQEPQFQKYFPWGKKKSFILTFHFDQLYDRAGFPRAEGPRITTEPAPKRTSK